MPDAKLVGSNYLAPDHHAKVTGRAKYAEDFRADGMLFTKLLLSPMPHARVLFIDTEGALAMPGVKAILTADDLPDLNGAEKALTNEPLYVGEPILAVAAVDEESAAAAVEAIRVDLEPLPFVVDPLDSLRPGGPNARTQGNIWAAPQPPTPGQPPAPPAVETLKWAAEDFADDEGEPGRLPMGKAVEEWSFGDLEAGFTKADLVLDESFIVQSTGHHPMETRSAMAYWQNGKLYLHGSTQSVAFNVATIARWVGIEPSNVVLICEFTGGGFGSKGNGAVSMTIPALLSKKANAPVMMRISREEESYIGRARTNMSGRARVGFTKDGRITALDLFLVQDSGAYGPMGDHRSAGNAASLIYQPGAMRWRAVNVLTNTPPRTQQRSPGPMQANGIMEPVITKAAKQLGLDQVAIRRINSPEGKANYGPAGPNGRRPYTTSAFVKEALDRGSEVFEWEMRKARSGQRRGPKVRGVGVTVGPHGAGSVGFDSIMTLRPDGRLYVQSGVGNLGTHSVFDLARVAADVLAMPWEKVEVIWGNTGKHLPWTCLSVGSQTTHAMTRANYAGAMDAKRKLQEIAAMDLGGSPDDYDVSNERVHRRGNPGGGLTYAQAARRAIELGGRFDGHVVPDDVNAMTKTSAAALVGLGLMGVAKDNHPRDGNTFSFVIGFAEVEVDTETGKVTLVDYLSIGDVGTVVNPRSLIAQLNGGSCLG
ncbi:MAG TPA: xanthine dehydrogenase family protein, partial [Vicinamibacterales bacterium]|nr:xanthine dehydrogenase family protein [Vicinamibacterales bacterium]